MSVYSPAEPTVYGRIENRIKPLQVLHLPWKAESALDTEDEDPQIFVVGTSLIYYVDGNFYTVGIGASSGRFGLEDNTATENRSMDMDGFAFSINGGSNINLGVSVP